MKRILIPLVLLLIIVAAWYMLDPLSGDGRVDIRGTITKVTPGTDGKTVFLMVEGPLQPDTTHDKASIRIVPKDTRIYIRQNDKLTRGTVADLKEQVQVEVDFGNNPVMESYPVQTKAKRVVILK
ncbi:hypothetical protein [Paenibacillus koleovorans]|uniref:hypothetical protein n=1 Tax=Paenibacillus koleovorans TaxID=121608 RepID=UPI000FD8897B|nr:hypothetical protein [Paenibacillus koleovorans]